MPLAVTHVIITIVLVDLYRHYIAKNSFSRVYVLIAGISGLLPDIDVPLSWLLSLIFQKEIWVHAIFTHSVILGVIFLLIGLFIHFSKNKKVLGFSKLNATLFFIMISIGWLIHVFLDCTLTGGGGKLSWIPFIAEISFCPRYLTSDLLAGIDAAILLLWLIHEEVKHKIKDYF